MQGIPKALEEDDDEDNDDQDIEASAQATTILKVGIVQRMNFDMLQAVANDMANAGLKPADPDKSLVST